MSPAAGAQELAATRQKLFYGWYVVAAVFLIYAVVYAMRYSFSLLYVVLLQDYGWSRGSTAIAFSLNYVIYGFMAPVVGALIDRLGPRLVIPVSAAILALGAVALSRSSQLWQFYLFFGVVMGPALCGAGYVAESAVLSRWFVRRRALAYSIAGSGFGVSYLILLGFQYLTDSIGWRPAYLVLAGLVAVIVLPLALLVLRRSPEDLGLAPDGAPPTARPQDSPHRQLVVDQAWASTQWTLGRAVRNRRFWALFWAVFLCWGVVGSAVAAHQVAFAVDVGFSRVVAASIFALVGVLSTVGTAMGFVSDRIGREATFSLGVLGIVGGLAVLLLAQQASQPWLLYVYVVLYGLGSGVIGPTVVTTTADLFEGKHFGAINGLIVFGFAAGASLGPYLAGLAFDLFGSYTWAFIGIIVAIIVAGILVWIAAPRKVRRVPGQAPGLVA